MAFKITGAFLIFWLPSIFILGDAASQVTKQGLIMKHIYFLSNTIKARVAYSLREVLIKKSLMPSCVTVHANVRTRISTGKQRNIIRNYLRGTELQSQLLLNVQAENFRRSAKVPEQASFNNQTGHGRIKS